MKFLYALPCEGKEQGELLKESHGIILTMFGYFDG